jgi:TRAP-type C4-dicarboxylate transport system permease large subunit
MICILVLYIILGCVMNVLPVIILTLPVIFPTVMVLGYDPIWFGVIMVLIVQIGVITPPIGMNVFAISGVAKGVPLSTIFRGIMPFWIAMIIAIAILIAFPQIALFLPNLLM